MSAENVIKKKGGKLKQTWGADVGPQLSAPTQSLKESERDRDRDETENRHRQGEPDG